MKLSIVMPVYNERATVEEIVRRVLAVELPLEKELVIVDDASTDGTGDILLRLLPGFRTSYFVLWPHLRMWRVSNPEPVLRSLQDADAAARALSRALSASAAMPARALQGISRADDRTARPEAAAAA